MTFAKMERSEVRAWTAWACSHDWAPNFVPYFDNATQEMVTASWEHTDEAGWAVVEARHRTPKAMRDWAGY